MLLKVFYVLQRLVLSPNKRYFLRSIVIFFLPRNLKIPTTEENKLIYNLDRDGFIPFDFDIKKEQISDILNFLEKKPLYESYDKKKSAFFISDKPVTAHTASYFDNDIVKCPHLFDFANNDSLIRIISSSLGCTPTLSNLKVWHSFKNNDLATNSENYHRDVDDIAFLKVFVYLTDVLNDNSGPHVFIKGSHKDTKFNKIRRFSDEEIENEYENENIIVFKGKKGTSFIENTFGIHKGLVARNDNRILLQFEYSLLPIGGYDYNKIIKTKVIAYDSYINRLYSK